jgi:hypothetical protein
LRIEIRKWQMANGKWQMAKVWVSRESNTDLLSHNQQY